MLVFWEQRLVILATPKTGSTAIEFALESLASLAVQRPPQLKHTTANRYRAHVAPYLRATSGEDFSVVALMREPLDWLGSWYRYRQRDVTQGTSRSTHGLSFDEYIRAYLRSPQPDYANVGSQYRFLVPAKGPGVDRIFRYEDIGVFVEFLEERLDCEIILPRLNVSPEASMDISPEILAAYKAAMAKDYELYASLP